MALAAPGLRSAPVAIMSEGAAVLMTLAMALGCVVGGVIVAATQCCFLADDVRAG